VPAGVRSGAVLRVLMTADGVGGVWQYALELARGFAAGGIQTVLVVLGPPLRDGQAEQARSIANLRLVETDLPLEWTARSPEEVRRAGRTLAQLALDCRADLVHLNAPALADGTEFRVPLVVVAHSCLASWWASVRGGPMPEDFVWRTRCMASGLRAADAVIAPSRSFAEALGAVYGPGLDVRVVHNGRAIAVETGAIGKARYVLTAGRLWDDGKNAGMLDRVAAHLNVPVFAAGPAAGPLGQTARYQHLHMLGSLGEAEIAKWYGAAPIFASTARYEPFGLSVLEAARAGAALVLSDIPSFRELWQGAARFVALDDDGALLETLRRLLARPAELRGLAEAARRRAASYSARAMVAATLQVYRSLSTAPRRAAVL
jgi:glycogen(starch) synthase